MSTAQPLPPPRSFRRYRSASPPLRMEPASGRELETAPIAFTNVRERAKPGEEVRESAVTIEESATSLVARKAIDVAPIQTRPVRISAPISVEQWVEPEPSEPPAPAQQGHVLKLRSLPRPSWLLVLCALACVGLIAWWFSSTRTPTLDPQRIIDSQLRAAEAAANEGHYAEPYEGSALHYYSTVLTIDATNPQALAGLQSLADQLITSARAHLTAGRYADAVIELNGARRIDPSHRGLSSLEGDLRRELQTLAVRVPAAAPEAVAAMPSPSANASTQLASIEKKERAPSVATRVPDATSGVGVSVPKVADATKPAPPPPVTTEAKTAAAAAGGAAVLAAAIDLPPTGANIEVADVGGAASSPEGSNSATSTPAASESSSKTALLPPIVKYVPPQYPDEARVRGLEGWADLSFLVAPTGDVIDPRVEDSSRRQLFGRPALAAVRKWRYEPPSAGHPSLTERTKVRIEFQLER